MKLKLTFELDSPELTEDIRQDIQTYLSCHGDDRHMFWAESLAVAIEQIIKAIRWNATLRQALSDTDNTASAVLKADRIHNSEYTTYVMLETAKVEIE